MTPKAIIFDVDGTLYHQPSLRRRMLRVLLTHYLVRPHKLFEFEILRQFRKEREKMAHDTFSGIENEQYRRCAEKTGANASTVKTVVEKWMFEKPLKHLPDFVFPGVQAFFQQLSKNGIKTGVYSDYRADGKLQAMGLEADAVVCSTDPEIDRLKPNPKGLLAVAEMLGVAPSECLYIGDRHELDGEAATNAGMPYRIIEPTGKNDSFFQDLMDEIFP